MPAGPKRAADSSSLPFVSDLVGAERFAEFCERYLVVPKGIGAGEPMRLRPWQVEMLRPFLDPDPRPAVGAIMGPRGLGKTGVLAGLGLWSVYDGPVGNEVPIIAVDERMAGRLLLPAAQMVELNPELASRAKTFRDRIEIPGKRSMLMALPAEAKRIEGLGTWTIALVDELGEVDPDTWRTLILGAGKAGDSSMALGIGTPPNRDSSVLMELRERWLADPDNPNLAFVEFSAAGFEDHPPTCVHCLELANPQLDDFLSRTKALAMLDAGGEDEYRRKRLCQAIRTNTAPFIRPEVWAGLARPEPIPDGAEVVIGLDGAFGGRDSDACALVIGTVSKTPHYDVLACYENATGDPTYRVDLLQVEQDIRDAAKRYKVREMVADPFRLGRTLQILTNEGITVSEFPWSPSRTTKATSALHSAALAGEFTHADSDVLTRHVMAATVIESNGGLRIGKTSRKRSAAKIDCAAALLMCHSRTSWLATRPTKRRRVIGTR